MVLVQKTMTILTMGIADPPPIGDWLRHTERLPLPGRGPFDIVDSLQPLIVLQAHLEQTVCPQLHFFVPIADAVAMCDVCHFLFVRLTLLRRDSMDVQRCRCAVAPPVANNNTDTSRLYEC
jgi:hypothetical protein